MVRLAVRLAVHSKDCLATNACLIADIVVPDADHVVDRCVVAQLVAGYGIEIPL